MIQNNKENEKLDPDNMDDDMVRYCMQSKGFILNPIIDWEDEDVWEFIHRYNIPYCELYDKGFKRLGCIGCPMSAHRKEELEMYPKFKEAYIRAFDRMIKNQIEGGGTQKKLERRTMDGMVHNQVRDISQSHENYIPNGYTTDSKAEDIMKWWLQ